MTLVALYSAAGGRWLFAFFLFFGGYFLQWLGHVVQGSEMGELALVRRLAGRGKAARGR